MESSSMEMFDIHIRHSYLINVVVSAFINLYHFLSACINMYLLVSLLNF